MCPGALLTELPKKQQVGELEGTGQGGGRRGKERPWRVPRPALQIGGL